MGSASDFIANRSDERGVDLGNLLRLMLCYVDWTTCKVKFLLCPPFPEEVAEELEAVAAALKKAGESWEQFS